MAKKVARKVQAKQEETKLRVRKARGKANDATIGRSGSAKVRVSVVQKPKSKADDAAVKEYAEKYDACQVIARPVMVAKEFMDQAGGYEKAFVFLDALQFVALDEPKAEPRRANAKADDSEENDYWKKYKVCEAITRKVLTAEKLVKLTGGYDEAQMLLDTVMVVMEGKQGHEQVAKVRGSAAGHHEILAAAARAEEGK